MANNVEQSPYFRKQIASGTIITRDPPKFDLDAYISNYIGRTRLDRLTLIGQTSTYLSLDALHAAIAQSKQGAEVQTYLNLTECLHDINPSDALAVPDVTWVEETTRRVKNETDRLEAELKAYKNNLIKESIRMGNEELGAHYLSVGDFTSSYKSYYRMRDYCTTPKHITEMSLKLIYVALMQRNFMTAQSQILKLQTQATARAEDKTKLEPILTACMGLAQLSTGSYADAASSFLSVSPNFITSEPLGGIDFTHAVLTPNDIAVYGGLTALASMNRAELQSRVLDNSTFRTFLELEPHIRRAISLFCSSKYSACLATLEAYRADYTLDIHLHAHIADIYNQVRVKSIQQFFIPFSRVTLDEMARAFPPPSQSTSTENSNSNENSKPHSIDDELSCLISADKLPARLDLVDRLLIAPAASPRLAAHADAVEMARRYEHTLLLRLGRLNTLNSGLDVKAPKEKQGGFGEFVGDLEQMGKEGLKGLGRFGIGGRG
ncbi:COP9 signalosome-like protein complex subunit 1 [Patellaria atrata CBS 101060]|uniref:COP9 signalosome-like protein complex subunit 1 n=1 Tax=Patellaria atrata CBS 101060 TaxID=1346257 RepID=A0A9P4SA82_9PEZI|nr:COP9 signalosome-like protein complex subunit 1 [Patellaria atrata CBS 101060]